MAVEEHSHNEIDLVLSELKEIKQELAPLVEAQKEREVVSKLFQKAKAGLLVILQVIGACTILLEIFDRIRGYFRP